MKKIILSTTTLGILLLIISNVVVSSTFTTTGEKIKMLEVKKDELIHQNRVLENQILARTSLTYLWNKAETAGFVNPDKIISLSSSPAPVALSLP